MPVGWNSVRDRKRPRNLTTRQPLPQNQRRAISSFFRFVQSAVMGSPVDVVLFAQRIHQQQRERPRVGEGDRQSHGTKSAPILGTA